MRRGALPLLAVCVATSAGALWSTHGAAGAHRTVLRWPGPGPQLRSSGLEPTQVVQWNRSCETCHSEVAAQWRSSRHHAAYSNEAFQAALGREPETTRGFCIRCHAPESKAALGVDVAGQLGVACVTCHVPLGPVLAVERSGATASPHATFASPSFRSVDACKGCHEFELPQHRVPALMQRTVSEHQESGSPLSCSACHMAMRDGHRDHAFPGGYDEAFVRASLEVDAAQVGSRARIRLVPKQVTHAVPTGDLFRRLAVEVYPVGAAGERHGLERRYLARHYQQARAERVEVSDDRPHLGERLVLFELPPAARAGFDWLVRYERVGFHRGDDEAAAEVESSFVVASGTVRR
jgi:hypothetical protein